jgi:quercetin dioxygenase-like cupin family protein
MNKFSLTALGRRRLEEARVASSGRSSATVFGGHEQVMRQTLIALAEGERMGEHENPGEATLLALEGRVRLTAGEDQWEARTGDLLVVPDRRHWVEALEDSVILLTVAKLDR